MHSKIIDPKTHGKNVYDNTGSAAFTVEYLQHEMEEDEKEEDKGIFFNGERKHIKGEEVINQIDNNIKGLRKDEVKFHSLVISPSQEELKHIGNDKEKLRQYTVAVMENYAANFNLRNGQKLTEKDLVWYGSIHHDRLYKNLDARPQSGEEVTVGEKKPGLQTHIHVIVSRRDASMKHTLNPQGMKSKFNIKDWQVRNGESFEKMFDYEKCTISPKLTQTKEWSAADMARHQERLDKKIDYFNELLPDAHRLDKAEIGKLAEKRNYDKTFFMNLNKLAKWIKEGKLVDNFEKFLDRNKSRPEYQQKNSNALTMGKDMVQAIRRLQNTSKSYDGYIENLELRRKRRRKNLNIDSDLEM